MREVRDTFLNTAVDCTLAMGQFIAAAEAIGLGTCPISYVRSHIERVTPLLSLPPGVYPVSGLSVGWPVFRRPVSMRLPPSVVVHPPREGVGWSENVARQLSVPERFGFAAYLRTRGFDLA